MLHSVFCPESASQSIFRKSLSIRDRRRELLLLLYLVFARHSNYPQLCMNFSNFEPRMKNPQRSAAPQLTRFEHQRHGLPLCPRNQEAQCFQEDDVKNSQLSVSVFRLELESFENIYSEIQNCQFQFSKSVNIYFESRIRFYPNVPFLLRSMKSLICLIPGFVRGICPVPDHDSSIMWISCDEEACYVQVCFSLIFHSHKLPCNWFKSLLY